MKISNGDSQAVSQSQEYPEWITRWYEQAYYSLVIAHTPPESAIPTREEIRSIKVLDFFVMPARLVAKVQENRGKTVRVDINFRPFVEEEWDRITGVIADSSYLFAHVLAERFTEGFAEELRQNEIQLIPSDPNSLLITPDELGQPLPLRFILAVFSKLFEQLHDSPFSIFTLQGRGKEETLEACRYQRFHRVQKHREDTPYATSYQSATSTSQKLTADRYWNYGQELQGLAETVRADELPAALLKRLDPIPVAELSERAEFILEETYSTLARRAQVMAFQMRSAR